MTEYSQTVMVDLRRSPAAPREAARAVRRLLFDSSAFALLDEAVLAVMELSSRASASGAGQCVLTATYHVGRGRLRVEVTEQHRDPLAPVRPRPDASSLPFVTALATEWGVEPCPDGQLVWFEMLQFRVADVPV